MLTKWSVAALLAHYLFLYASATYDNTQVYQRHLQIPHVGTTENLGLWPRGLVTETSSGRVILAGNTADNSITIGSNSITLNRKVPEVWTSHTWVYVAGAQDDFSPLDWVFTIETVNQSGASGTSQYTMSMATKVLPWASGALVAGTYGGGTWFGSNFENKTYMGPTQCPFIMNVTESGQVAWRWCAICSATKALEFFIQDIVLFNSYFVVGGHGYPKAGGVLALSSSIVLPPGVGVGGVFIFGFSRLDGTPLWYYTLWDAYYIGHLDLPYSSLAAGPGDTVYFTCHFYGGSPSTFPLTAIPTVQTNIIGQVNAITGQYIKTVAAVVGGSPYSSYKNSLLNFGRGLFYRYGLIYVPLTIAGSFCFCTGGNFSTCETTPRLMTTCNPDQADANLNYPTCTSYDYVLLQYNINTTTWSIYEHYTGVYSAFDNIFPRAEFLVDSVTNFLYQVLPYNVAFSQVANCVSLHELYEDYTGGFKHDDLIILVRDLDTMECLATASYGTPPGLHPGEQVHDQLFGINVYPGSNMVFASCRAGEDTTALYFYEPGYPVFAICVCHKGFCNRWGKCICDPGYGGLRCNKLCPGFVSTTTGGCSGHGYCNQADVSCVCDVGYNTSDCSNLDCSGHGKTVSGVCLCVTGWTGPACATATATS